MDAPHRMLIFGLPKQLTPKKFKKLIGCQNNTTDLWELELLVPLENASMAQVICSTSANYDKLSKTIFKLGRPHPLSLCRLRDFDLPPTEPEPFTNKDCLWQIFEWCPLKTQIALAKVCRLYHELIEAIWRAKYKTLRYNLKDWHCREQLTPAEVCDFLAVVGEFVEHLVFWCYVYIPVMEIYQVHAMAGNYLTNSKHFINRLMCRHLAYFPNLRIFEVEGKFLFDWVVRSLAINCAELRIFRLLDCETRWLSGRHLWMLQNLRQCVLKDAKELHRRLVAKLCRRAKHLHTLDIVQCERLLESPPREMLLLCRNMQRLETLRLSALQDTKVLDAILRLHLKRLEFFWYDNAAFEAQLLPLLLQNKRSPTSLKFEQQRVYMENASQAHFDRRQNAELREKVAMEAPVWQFSEEVVRTLWELDNLNKIRCVYCRPLSHEHMRELPVRCMNLKNIELFGCRDATMDNSLGRLWPIPLPRQKCCLSIDGVISAEDIQRFKDSFFPKHKGAQRSGRVLRSIECCFE